MYNNAYHNSWDAILLEFGWKRLFYSPWMIGYSKIIVPSMGEIIIVCKRVDKIMTISPIKTVVSYYWLLRQPACIVDGVDFKKPFLSPIDILTPMSHMFGDKQEYQMITDEINLLFMSYIHSR